MPPDRGRPRRAEPVVGVGAGPAVLVGLSYLVGALPLTQAAARILRGADLRTLGTGTVSGTNLYEVTGFGPLAVVGCLEVAKGAVGPLLARRSGSGPLLTAAAAGAAVTGHNWSPFLRFAGGRGLSPAMGATAVTAPEGTVLLAAGLGIGRLAGETALGCLAAIVALPAALGWRRGRAGVLAGAALAVPMVLKRILGNGPPPHNGRREVYLWRLLLDRDSRRPLSAPGPGSSGGPG